jgi:DNA-binding MarR family transcriptional regulator
MDDDLHALAENLITTSARMVRWAPTTSPFTVSLAAARILARLNHTGPTRITELAVAEGSSQPTITNHVKRLEATGFVRRSADTRDARARMIELTPQGEEQLRLLRNAIGTGVEPYLAQMPSSDLEALRQGVAAMHRLMLLQL